MTDRFDLEQDIMKCWNVIEDLQNLYDCEDLTEDQQQNYLLGLITIYEVKFNKLWNSFEHCVSNKEI
jgi:hypothetical protein